MQSIEQFAQADWFLLAFFVFGAALSLFLAIRMFHRARLIEDMPTSKIRSAHQGYVELYGTAKWLDGPEIVAPLSGQPCAWYSFTIEERSRHGRKQWRRIDHGISEHLFLLEDETGSCVIDPEDAEVTPSISETWYGSTPLRALDRLDINPTIKLLSKAIVQSGAPYRYTEKRININEPLYALGEFTSLGTDFRKEVDHLIRDILSKLKRDKKKLEKYDVNKDGEIDQNEWETARKDAQQSALNAQLNNPLPKSTNILKKPKTKKYQPFLLAAKAESYLSKQNLIFSYASAAVFIFLVASVFYKFS